MTRYVALLRGINVGGHRTVTMPRLRDAAGAAGLAAPATLLASGNLLVTSDLDAAGVLAALEAAILDEFGFAVETVVLTQDAVRALVAAHPRPEAPGAAIAFCSGPIDADAQARLAGLATAAETVDVAGTVAYLSFGAGQATSKLAAGIPRALAPLVVTVRNLATSRKLTVA
ncbi:DUF1697 domain-containing protein [Propioniciclava coleopterorum]|uniref:DUF1697 domain-containing protein n=1 Tax=Propioniciclava coleopterorum TaxID=2714937 RepID=A0A6G7YAD0_9ACTN|nr:DUF1697 domain-containing protein [Propioniciclava coleopterorum]QIK73601.1 DUF1697 domain-containing protein [Propioniciclava coleopterorum]